MGGHSSHHSKAPQPGYPPPGGQYPPQQQPYPPPQQSYPPQQPYPPQSGPYSPRPGSPTQAGAYQPPPGSAPYMGGAAPPGRLAAQPVGGARPDPNAPIEIFHGTGMERPYTHYSAAQGKTSTGKSRSCWPSTGGTSQVQKTALQASETLVDEETAAQLLPCTSASMTVKRNAEEAGLLVGNPHDPKACRPRLGVTPNLIVKDAEKVMADFCKATDAAVFFSMKEEETEAKRLMHGCVVTPSNGYIFFEDIASNVFTKTLAVPFSEYRCNDAEHVAMHVNIPNAAEVVKRMLASTALAKPSKIVVPLEKHFLGGTLGIVMDGCGFLWSFSEKTEEDTAPGPDPPTTDTGFCVSSIDSYLAFLKEVFGESLVEKEVCQSDSGIVHAELGLHGTGLQLDQLSEKEDTGASEAIKKGQSSGYVTMSMRVPTGQAAVVVTGLEASGTTVVFPPQMKFYGQVQGRVRLPSGVYMSINEPPVTEDGPSKEDIDAYIQIGEEHGWDMVCTLKALPFSRYVGIRSKEKTPMTEIHDMGFFPKCFKAVAKEIGCDACAGPPVAIYHHADPHAGLFTVTAGFPVKDTFSMDGAVSTPQGEMTLSEVPEKARTCAATTLNGTYDKLKKTWGALVAWHKARGCEFDSSVGICGVEQYMSDPKCQGEDGPPPVTHLYCPAPVVKKPAETS